MGNFGIPVPLIAKLKNLQSLSGLSISLFEVTCPHGCEQCFVIETNKPFRDIYYPDLPYTLNTKVEEFSKTFASP
jgi:hypothetical protein